MLLVRAVGVLSLLLTFAGGAQATVLYDNLPPNATSAGPDPIAGDGPQQYNSFTADASGRIDTVQLLLELDHGPSGSVVVGIYDDNGSDNPDLASTPHSVGTIDDTQLSGSASVFTFANLGITGLAGGSRYWVVLTDPMTNGNSSALSWDFATDDSGTGVAGEFSGATQLPTSPNDSAGPYIMCVSNDATASACTLPAVPEPASLSILGLGLVGLGLLRRFRSA